MGEELRRAFLATMKSRCTFNDKGCWLWTGALDRDGYAVAATMEIDGKHVQRAHRISFYLAYGWLPRLLDHIRCDERKCINPDHVEPSTDKKNVLRGKGPTAINASKTRCPKGHPYTGKKFQQGGWVRICQTCRNQQGKAAYGRKSG